MRMRSNRCNKYMKTAKDLKVPEVNIKINISKVTVDDRCNGKAKQPAPDKPEPKKEDPVTFKGTQYRTNKGQTKSDVVPPK